LLIPWQYETIVPFSKEWKGIKKELYVDIDESAIEDSGWYDKFKKVYLIMWLYKSMWDMWYDYVKDLVIVPVELEKWNFSTIIGNEKVNFTYRLKPNVKIK
jgi:hypothetical protein